LADAKSQVKGKLGRIKCFFYSFGNALSAQDCESMFEIKEPPYPLQQGSNLSLGRQFFVISILVNFRSLVILPTVNFSPLSAYP